MKIMRKFHRGYGYIGGVCDGLGQYFDIDSKCIEIDGSMLDDNFDSDVLNQFSNYYHS